jgi:hypothetical protein
MALYSAKMIMMFEAADDDVACIRALDGIVFDDGKQNR